MGIEEEDFKMAEEQWREIWTWNQSSIVGNSSFKLTAR